MRKLEFTGTVKSQAAPKLIIPGRDDLFLKPDDWPKRLAPGIVNVEVDIFPEGLAEITEGEGLARLDTGKFMPALVIPQRKIAGSILAPDSDHPTRGFAEVWRADLHLIGTKFFKLWQEELNAGRDPHKAFKERGSSTPGTATSCHGSYFFPKACPGPSSVEVGLRHSRKSAGTAGFPLAVPC